MHRVGHGSVWRKTCSHSDSCWLLLWIQLYEYHEYLWSGSGPKPDLEVWKLKQSCNMLYITVTYYVIVRYRVWFTIAMSRNTFFLLIKIYLFVTKKEFWNQSKETVNMLYSAGKELSLPGSMVCYYYTMDATPLISNIVASSSVQ